MVSETVAALYEYDVLRAGNLATFVEINRTKAEELILQARRKYSKTSHWRH